MIQWKVAGSTRVPVIFSLFTVRTKTLSLSLVVLHQSCLQARAPQLITCSAMASFYRMCFPANRLVLGPISPEQTAEQAALAAKTHWCRPEAIAQAVGAAAVAVQGQAQAIILRG